MKYEPCVLSSVISITPESTHHKMLRRFSKLCGWYVVYRDEDLWVNMGSLPSLEILCRKMFWRFLCLWVTGVSFHVFFFHADQQLYGLNCEFQEAYVWRVRSRLSMTSRLFVAFSCICSFTSIMFLTLISIFTSLLDRFLADSTRHFASIFS